VLESGKAVWKVQQPMCTENKQTNTKTLNVLVLISCVIFAHTLALLISVSLVFGLVVLIEKKN
jgi:hypothetical protein